MLPGRFKTDQRAVLGSALGRGLLPEFGVLPVDRLALVFDRGVQPIEVHLLLVGHCRPDLSGFRLLAEAAGDGHASVLFEAVLTDSVGLIACRDVGGIFHGGEFVSGP